MDCTIAVTQVSRRHLMVVIARPALPAALTCG
jgi:hypothetical protein